VCQLDTLGKCRNRAALRKSLATLPLTLEKTYDRILLAITEEDSIYAIRILQWLTVAERPLSVDEIAEVVAIDETRERVFDEEEVLQDPMDALEICSSLVTVQDITYGEKAPWAQVVTLAHYSVKEYLISERICAGQLSRYSMNIDTCHARLARACLGYLQQILQVRLGLEEHLRISKLLPYCSDYWMCHMNRAGKCEIGTARTAAQFLSSGSTAYRSWLEIYEVGRPWLYPEIITTEDKAVDPLYYAASFDLVDVLRVLLDEGADATTQTGRDIHADHLVVVDERERQAVSLLAQGDAKDAWTRHYGSPLRAASELGHEQVVRLLLDAGADINFDTPIHGSALNMAVSSEEVSIVSLLLKNGADVEAIWCNGGTPLIMAASKGHTEIVKLLLSRGATLSATDSYGWTPLISAAAKGRTETVKLLLENGADIESVNHEGCTPLISAAYNGHLGVVEVLLAVGADVSAMSEDGLTPLIAAGYKDHYAVAKLLLEHEISNGLLSAEFMRRVLEGRIDLTFITGFADRSRGPPWYEHDCEGSGWWLHRRPATIHLNIWNQPQSQRFLWSNGDVLGSS
jgi:ankyrin repeat protein